MKPKFWPVCTEQVNGINCVESTTRDHSHFGWIQPWSCHHKFLRPRVSRRSDFALPLFLCVVYCFWHTSFNSQPLNASLCYPGYAVRFHSSSCTKKFTHKLESTSMPAQMKRRHLKQSLISFLFSKPKFILRTSKFPQRILT